MTNQISAVDLFCGAGGLTYGLNRAGINVAAAIDVDSACEHPVVHNNPNTRFVRADIKTLCADELLSLYPKGDLRLLAGCAPCQPFSTYSRRGLSDQRWKLIFDFARLVDEISPHAFTMENVPDLMRRSPNALASFLKLLDPGYVTSAQIVRCTDLGVPQTRQRLVVLGIRRDLLDTSNPHLKLKTGNSAATTVRDTIGHLPSISAGATAAPDDRYHVASRLSKLNLKRIRATPEGGGWRDWPPELLLDCHRKKSGRYYGSVYGRMSWDEPAPTITTQCFGYGNGRFGHPDQDRAISLREAALLQGFPQSYSFVPPDNPVAFKTVGRLIGNAVPVPLAIAVGETLRELLPSSPG